MWDSKDDDRYGENWGKISAAAKRQCPVCCYCMKRTSKNTHHVRYVNNRKRLLLDSVILGKDIFPVCLECHKILHTRINYQTHANRHLNHNKKLAKLKLAFGFRVLYIK